MIQESNFNVYASTVNGKLTIDELLKKEQEFPFCSMIQFQLLQEYQKMDTESFNERAQKSALYFSDLLKLNWILHLNNQAIQQANEFTALTTVTNTGIENIPHEKDVIETPWRLADENYNGSSEDNSIVLETEEKIETVEEVHPPQINAVPSIEVINIDEPVVTQEPILEVHEKIPSTPLSVTQKPEIENKISDIIEVQEVESLSVSDQKTESSTIPGSSKHESRSGNDELVFEPLYTKDYFASQGIKLVDNSAPTDKLGNQMKSFTQWLKSMKKINLEKLNEPDEIVDKKIQTIAEKSNTTEEIITESMADVLLLQGKHDKAIEMYEKLSLINPSKSAYFAAIIQVLKKA